MMMIVLGLSESEERIGMNCELKSEHNMDLLNMM